MNLPKLVKSFSIVCVLWIISSNSSADTGVEALLSDAATVTYDCPSDIYKSPVNEYLASDEITQNQRFRLTTLQTHYQNCNGQSNLARDTLKDLIAHPEADKDSQYYASAVYQIGFTYDVEERSERCGYYVDAFLLSNGRFKDIELSSTLGMVVNNCNQTGYATTAERLAALFQLLQKYSDSDNFKALAHIHNNIGLFYGKQSQHFLAADQFLKAYDMGETVYTGSNRLSILISGITSLLYSEQFERARTAIEEFNRVNQEVDTPLTNLWYLYAKAGYHYRKGEIEALQEVLIPFGDMTSRFNVPFYRKLFEWYNTVPCLINEDKECLRTYAEKVGDLKSSDRAIASIEYTRFMARVYLMLEDLEKLNSSFDHLISILDNGRTNEQKFAMVAGISNLYTQVYVLENQLLAAERRKNALLLGGIIIALLLLVSVVVVLRRRHLYRQSLDPVTELLNSKTAINKIAQVPKPSADKTNALAIFDLANFREVNRQVGSTEGDLVMREIAKTLSKVTRDQDILGRFAPEQFILCLTDIEEDSAKSFFERVQTALESTSLNASNRSKISIRSSMSIYISLSAFDDLNAVLDDMLLSLSLSSQR